MRELTRIVLLLETSLEYGRALLRGVVRYEQLHGPWSLHVLPGHFHHALPTLTASSRTGILARIASAEEARTIENSGNPAVVLEPSLDESRQFAARCGFHEIVSDSPAIARIAADHLLGLGLTRFAYCGFGHCPWSRVRETSFASYLETHGFTCATFPTPADAGGPWEHDLAQLTTWLRALPKPVGLMTCNDICGQQILEACAEAAIHVPDEVTVVGVDNDELICQLANPPLSSVALDLEEAGYAAAELLHRLLSGQSFSKRQVVPVRPMGVTPRRSSEPVLHSNPLVAKALRFIRDHAGSPIGVEDVSSHMGVSRRTLERQFHASHGLAVGEEITNCRLTRAKRLLRETDLPAYRVAEASGFGGIQPMMRLFRRRESMTPMQYRRSLRPEVRQGHNHHANRP